LKRGDKKLIYNLTNYYRGAKLRKIVLPFIFSMAEGARFFGGEGFYSTINIYR